MDASNSSEIYAPLWVKSNFSFLEGASHPEELIERAHALSLPAIALTDREGLYGIVQAHTKAKELGIKLIIGSQIDIVSSPDQPPSPLILLVRNRAGYQNLCRLISDRKRHTQRPAPHPPLETLASYARGIICLSPTPNHLVQLREIFPDTLYALIARHRHDAEQEPSHHLRATADRLSIPLIGSNEVLYHDRLRRPLQDTLTCIRHGVDILNATPYLRPNSEHDLRPSHEMYRLFSDHPEMLHRSNEVAQRCTFSLSELSYRYPTQDRPDGLCESDWLRALTYEGAKRHYPDGLTSKTRRQIERELSLIHELDYGGYFLTMWEIVQFCRRQNIFCQGRGSAANSIVCYCLGITAVDPIRLDLLFERFISKERSEPPDIDLDIEHERREEVIQWVYDRYGRDHAAMVANVVRYRAKAAARDIGKALCIPPAALDRASKLLGSRFASPGRELLTQCGLDPDTPRHGQYLKLVDEIQDFPRHLSIHPGGFLLGHDPVHSIVPIEPASMPGRTIIQWDKYSVEAMGLFKVDLLGLGALTHIHKSLDLLRQHHGLSLELTTVPHEDPPTYEMISRGDTVGVFQIESRAQMSMLPRLRPRTYYDLVVQVAIVRPGPIQGNMVHPYLQRRTEAEPPQYPHPRLEPVLAKTLGVPIFQEQVMKIAMLVGGYSPGEADQLRRDMAAWKFTGRIERHHDKLVSRMIDNGLAPEFAEKVFSQIRGFGEYGFPESHAASFALLAYITAYLRCHYPAAFACALLNSLPMGFYAPATIVEDIKRRGVSIRPIDVCRSDWDCTLEVDHKEPSIRMGMRYVSGLSDRDRKALAHTPKDVTTLQQFVRSSQLPLSSLQRIAEAGGFDPLVSNRRRALWLLNELTAARSDPLPLSWSPASKQQSLFAPLDQSEAIFWDHQASRHSTRGHPLAQFRFLLSRQSCHSADALNRLRDGKKAKYVGVVICRQQPGTATGVTFCTLEDETGLVNLVLWRNVYDRFSVIVRTASILGVSGTIQAEAGVVHLIAQRLWRPQLTDT